MKGYTKLIIYLLCISVCLTTAAQAQEKKKKAKNIAVTTGDIRESYEIIDIVSASISDDDLENLARKLKEKARALKADAVVSVKYLLFRGRLYAYGTAVKLKED